MARVFRVIRLAKAHDAPLAMPRMTLQRHRPGVSPKRPKRTNNESGARLLGTLALESVHQRPLDRAGGDDRSDDLLGLGMGDRDRQDGALCAHASSHGPFRAGVLVGAVARG